MSPFSKQVDRIRNRFSLGVFGKLLAAVVVGVGVGTAVPPEPMTVPAVGTVPSAVVGAVLVVGGYVAFTRIPTRSDCGCGGECSCS